MGGSDLAAGRFRAKRSALSVAWAALRELLALENPILLLPAVPLADPDHFLLRIAVQLLESDNSAHPLRPVHPTQA